MKLILTMNIPYVFAHGGANKANRYLAEGFAANGHDVRVVIPAVGVPARLTIEEFAERLEREGYRFTNDGRAFVFELDGVEVHAVADAAQLRSYLADEIDGFAPDWVLVSTEDPSQTLLATALAADPSRVVYLVHGPVFLPFGPQSFFASPVRQRLVEQVAGIITCSRSVANYVHRWTGLEATPIYWPAYGPGPFPDLSNPDAGYVTLVNPCAVKGLEIFEELVRTMPEVSFAGVPTWGTTDENLQALAELPNLTLLPPSDDIEDILAQSRVLLMPSLWPEGFPLTCVEAMARGIPVLASDTPGLDEAKLGTDFILPVRSIEGFSEEVDAHLVPIPIIPPQDADPWRRAVREILGDRELYVSQSASQRRTACDFIASLGVEPFEDFLAERARRPRRQVAAAAAEPPAAEAVAMPAGVDKLSPEKQALLMLWLRKKGAAQPPSDDRPPPIRPLPRDGELPLSFAQRRLWFLDQLEPGSPLYNMPSAVRLRGGLEVPVLRRTLAALLDRHEVLRSTYHSRGGRPVQEILHRPRLELPVIDLSALDRRRREAEAARRAEREAARPFDLSRGPLLRGALLRLGAEEHVLLLTMHHIVSDGWTFGILVREMAALYEAFSACLPSPLPELEIQYADFAAWQRQLLQGERLESQLDYWRQRLAGLKTSVELPTDRPRPKVLSFRSASRGVIVPPALARALRDLGQRQGASLFMVLLAAWKALVARYTGVVDLAVGTPIANRNHDQVEGVVGCFVNTLVLRTDLDGDPDFREAVKRVRDSCLGAYAHQDLPYEKLVEELRPERDLSHSPFFHLLFLLQNTPASAMEMPGVTLEPLGQEGDTAKFDLTVAVTEGRQGLGVSMRYRRQLFEATTVERFLRHYRNLLEAAAADPGTPLSRLSMLAPSERHQLLREWNDTGSPAAPERPVHELIAERAAHDPDAVAVVYEDHQLTFRALDRWANRLARLLQSQGVGPERPVGILLERSAEMVIALLAVWKAGGAYLAIAPDTPRQRVALMLSEARSKLLISHRRLAGRWPETGVRALSLDRDWGLVAEQGADAPEPGTGVRNAAYLLFTSGSTGRPKGVVVEHRQLLNYLEALRQRVALEPGWSYALPQSPAVDVGNSTLFPPLMDGGRLVVISEERALDPRGFAVTIRRHRLEVLKIAPTHLAALLAEQGKEALLPRRRLILGGEASERRWAEELAAAPGMRLDNHYGPTETTVGVCTYRLAPERRRRPGAGLPLGRPLDGVRFYLLDRRLRPVPLGGVGELYVAGDTVSRGYCYRPERTAWAYLPDPFTERPGERMYRTGDRVRQHVDGIYEFLGRGDHQVKIRGFRIETGEIEAALQRHPAVTAAAVTVRGSAAAKCELVAFVVPGDGGAPPPGELMTYLRLSLPEPMVPRRFAFLDRLPRLPHGKLDRKALDSADAELHGPAGGGQTPPRTPAERRMAKIWARVLGAEAVGVDDDFFELGGHSLLATQLISRIREAFDRPIPLRTLFEHPTVAGMVAEIERVERGDEGAAAEAPITRTARGARRVSWAQLEKERQHA